MPREMPDFTAMARSLFLEPGKCPHDDANMHGPRYGCPECMADDLRAAYIAGLRRALEIAMASHAFQVELDERHEDGNDREAITGAICWQISSDIAALEADND